MRLHEQSCKEQFACPEHQYAGSKLELFRSNEAFSIQLLDHADGFLRRATGHDSIHTGGHEEYGHSRVASRSGKSQMALVMVPALS